MQLVLGDASMVVGPEPGVNDHVYGRQYPAPGLKQLFTVYSMLRSATEMLRCFSRASVKQFVDLYCGVAILTRLFVATPE